MTKSEFIKQVETIGGKTIAVVYIFEGETAPGACHYAIWGSDVISAWIEAIQEIRCIPLILDVRTFAQKAMNGTLPHIDFVVNLNNGTRDLSSLSLVPSICAFIGVPCIPCDSFTALLGENKKASNTIARALGFNVPNDLDESSDSGINRPINFGSSIGVKKGARLGTNGLYQKFIPGFDMTTPLLYNPVNEAIETLPPIMYLPDSKDPMWFLGEEEKEKHSGYSKIAVKIDSDIKAHMVSIARYYGIPAFCRIDSRILCETSDEMIEFTNKTIPFERLYFIEINPMPTISAGINFLTSVENVGAGDSFEECLSLYKGVFGTKSYTGFILLCTILANLKATH